MRQTNFLALHQPHPSPRAYKHGQPTPESNKSWCNKARILLCFLVIIELNCAEFRAYTVGSTSSNSDSAFT